jgi:hypothetical protein
MSELIGRRDWLSWIPETVVNINRIVADPDVGHVSRALHSL